MITSEITRTTMNSIIREYTTLESVISSNSDNKILLLVLIAVLTNL
jgi:hypothetical protein